MKKVGPKQRYEKIYDDGRIVTLDVYAPTVTTQTSFTPGSTNVSGGVTYYTKSRVDVKNLTGSLLLNVHFFVDHYKNSNGSGSATNAYLYGGNGNGVLTPGSAFFDQKTGSQVVVRVEIFLSGAGSDNVGAKMGESKITFNASTFAIGVYDWI